MAYFALFKIFFFRDEILLCLDLRLECSGMIMAHCSLDLPAFQVAGIAGMCDHTWLMLKIFCKDRVLLCCPGCLELLASSDLPAKVLEL
uniref:Uncharacterized protein n=1 Tax=Macaca fascicularis TaxID=9541 RepID=A0A2K5VX90_MACFA